MPRAPRPDDLFRLRIATEPRLSPDGSVAVVTVQTVAPGYDRALYPHGVNIEFVTPVRDGRVAMRVHERGVGETRSCGTGTVAAVVAALRAAGETTGDVGVQTPGGRLLVTVTPDTTVLHGPAVLVASGELDADWWAAL